MPVWLREFFADRIQINSLLFVLCFASVLLLESQSAASYPSYFLALSVLLTYRQWNDVLTVPLFWFVIATIGYLFLSSFWSEPAVWRDAVGMFGRSLLVLAFVVAMAECQQRGQVQRWLGRALAIVGALAAVAALLAFMFVPPRHGRLAGLGQLDNPVVVGLVFGAVIILLVEIVITDVSKFWRWAAAAGAVPVFLDVLLSDSRSALFSTVIGTCVLIFAWRVRDRQRFVAAMIVLAVLASVLLLTLVSTGTGLEVLLPRGDSFRLDIWSNILSDMRDGPLLFGKGILTPDHIMVGAKEFQHPHSMYVSVFFQGGLVGLVLYMALIGWTVSELLTGYGDRSAKLALGLLSMALTSYFLDGHELIDKVGETWFLFWLPMSIALGLAWSRRLRSDEDLA
jgi:O-antigen ligase